MMSGKEPLIPMKTRAFIFASTLVFLIATASLCLVLGAGRTAAIGFLTLAAGLLIGLLVYLLDKHVMKGRQERQAGFEEALDSTGFSEARTYSSGSTGSALFRRQSSRDQLFPALEMRQGAENLSRPTWLPDELSKHW